MKLSRAPLLLRLAAILAAVGLLPFGLAFYQLRENKDALLDQMLRTHIVAVSSSASQVDSLLTTFATMASSAAGNPVLSGDPLSPVSQELLRGLLTAHGSIGAVVLFDPSWGEVVRAQRRDLAEELSPALAAGRGQPVALVDGRERRWLRFEEPLAGAEGRLVLLAEAAPLERLLEARRLDEQADFVLAARDGTVLLGAASVLSSLPPQPVEEARTGKLDSGAGKYRAEGEETAGEQVVAYQQITEAPWFVLSTQPAAAAERAQSRIRRMTWATAAAALLLAALLTAGAYLSVIRPLRRLARAQRELAGLDPETAEGSEIEQLENAFSTLEQGIRDREELGKVFLGRYQVVELAGSGSMGNVFRGWDPKLRRPVALKTIRIDAAKFDKDSLTRLLVEEAVAYARFSHPNIVTVHDILEGGDSACIAMEMVEGLSLEAYLKQRGRLPASEVIPLGAAIASALASAHEHELVHHDVKPANVLLGLGGSIKVTDFGVSELLSAATKEKETVCGTPGYIPPESLENGHYSARSDLFALGVVLYQCLTGKHPFLARTAYATLLKTFTAEVEPVRAVHPEVPEALSDLVARLMAKQMEDRPESAAWVARSLELMAEDLGLRWQPDFSATDAAALGRAGVDSKFVTLTLDSQMTAAFRSKAS